ncbi:MULTISPECIES: ABC transporter ATP-binding protein [Acidianus]|uniref:ABC transporter ATP-binding protein n=1 Tax=Candidatus Acidianus copahuensis TaxID=1160895 RepID=A0A031LN06_9CREN|nr:MULTISPECIES: ABC transporter ATP-binding protein [Acidianus]EZQ04876.1 ABC transporter ATP-binding protein [Candidatus Acidianus copahuensis]NON61118.1 ABC transporter ATP-binding protein [Acidianus sp. RZ1]
MPKENVLKLEHVTKIYNGKIPVVALSDINLEIEDGELIAIQGPSGSGKTTLLTIMGTLALPTKGKVYIYGKDVTSIPQKEISKIRNNYIGFVFQSYNLIERLTVLKNVELPLIARGVGESERKRISIEILEKLGLKDLIYRKPNELSGGQQQRVAIARALAQNPKIILADEPTANLDSKSGEIVLETFKQANKDFGTTVILVTHDMDVANIAQRKIFIRDGKIIDIK